ncbi:hypothetical protein FE257_007370 [Aspergillus nanangensis]|uniref:NAD(P)-binding domain-containing protein n=1 Tax=Aspergillus nanangensis TaxID=2582783 RepID=A0AAD4GU81_ASPNN|nr:hypothetical protein FE257_007370 [Aspergillus nanangensis]
MGKEKILVLGGTGPAGICLLRELLSRNHMTVLFARNPAKVPADLLSNTLLEIVRGEKSDINALSNAVSNCSTVISFLGPAASMKLASTTVYADYYRAMFPLMRQHGVRRIFAMGTISIHQDEDRWSFAQFSIEWMVRIIANGPYHNIISIQKLFEEKEVTRDIDWTVFRIGNISGAGDDMEVWARDREDGDIYVGPLGAAGWSHSQKRARLARWLVDATEDGATEWIGQMPAVSKLVGTR